MRNIETEDCTLAGVTEETDGRGTVLDLYMRIAPLRVLYRWWPEEEAYAWAVMAGHTAYFCIQGRVEITLLSFRRYRTLCPAPFVAHAALHSPNLPAEMDCLTETVILDSRVPQVLTVPPDVFVFVKTTAMNTVILTSLDPCGNETVRLPARIVEATAG